LSSLIGNNAKWNVTSCMHTNNGVELIDVYYPKYTQDILLRNTISSPSVLMLYRDCYEEFDNNLLWYMDTDVYYRLGKKYGEPSICEYATVVNRRHEYQITRTRVNTELIRKETNYLIQKYEEINNTSK